MWRGQMCFIIFCIVLLLDACTYAAPEKDNLIVDISGLPDAYSSRSAAIEPILARHPNLRLRSYRRLHFASKSEELGYAIKTGNAPDVLCLSLDEYGAAALNGTVLDLSSYLLRGNGIDARWRSQFDFGNGALASLLVDDRVYAFPGRKRVHGVLFRRDLLETGDPIANLDLRGVAQMASRMAGRMPKEKRRSGIAIPLNANNFISWAIADFGGSWNQLQKVGGQQAGARTLAAVAGLQNTYDSLHSMLYSNWAACRSCGAVDFVRDGTVGACVLCGGRMDLGSDNAPLGRVVNNADMGLDLFAKGDVAMVLCTREDVLRLVDRSYSPDMMLFVPFSGASVVPDMELFAICASAAKRPGGQRRIEELADFLTDYTTQFQVANESPLYLWYERNGIENIVRRGYGSLYAPSEMASCVGLPFRNENAGGVVTDEAIQYSGILPVVEFLDIAGLSVTEAAALADGLRNGAFIDSGCLSALQRNRAMQLTPRGGRILALILLVVILASVGSLIVAGRRRRLFRAYQEGARGWVLVCLAPVIIAVSLRFVLVILSIVGQMAGAVTGGSFAPDVVGLAAGKMISALALGCFNVMVCVALGVFVSVAVALVFSRFKGWRVVLGFMLCVPLCLLGIWGSLLWESVLEWLFGTSGWALIPENASMSVLLRALPGVWAVMPFACMAYVYRLRRIDKSLYEALLLDGASSADSFFLATLPSLDPVLKLHSLVLACMALWSVDSISTGSGVSLGSTLLRSVLFGDNACETAFLSALIFALILLIVCLGLRWIQTIEFRGVYGRRSP